MILSRKIVGSVVKVMLLAGLALTGSQSGGAPSACVIERGIDPLDVLRVAASHNVYVILDTSGSMVQNFKGESIECPPGVDNCFWYRVDHPSSKIFQAKRVLKSVLDGAPNVNWGFVRFGRNPGFTGCGESYSSYQCDGIERLVDPAGCSASGADTRDAIKRYLRPIRDGGIGTGGATPDGKAIQQLFRQLDPSKLRNGTRNFFVLITDGEDTCERGDQFLAKPGTESDASFDDDVYADSVSDPALFTYQDTTADGIDNGTCTTLPRPILKEACGGDDLSEPKQDVRTYNAGARAAAAAKGKDGIAGTADDIETFVVGMGLGSKAGLTASGESLSRTCHIAWRGSNMKRGAFFAKNSNEFEDALKRVLDEISGTVSATITTGTPVVATVKELIPKLDPTNPKLVDDVKNINGTVRATYRNNVVFTTSVEVPGFKGHLVATRTIKLAKQKDPLTGQETSVVKPDLVTREWDAGEKLRDTLARDRTIYFNKRDSRDLDSFDLDRRGDIARELGIGSGFGKGFLNDIDGPKGSGALSDDDAVRMVIEVMRGRQLAIDSATGTFYKENGDLNFGDEVLDPGTGRPAGIWKLWDPLHAGPTVVLNPPRSPFVDAPAHDQDAYMSFFTTQYNRETVVYLATNGGMVHAFRAATGEELYAYVPDDVLPKLPQIVKLIVSRNQTLNNHVFTLSGAISVEDVFLRKANDSPVEGWRTVVALGRGPGGKYYTALDVTGALDKPKLLFNKGNRNDGQAGDYDRLGETWSQPGIGEVKTGPNQYQAVIVTGSGFGCKGTGEGKSLYVLKAENGEILKRFDIDAVAPGLGAVAPIADNALVAMPSLYNPHLADDQRLDGADYVTRVYIGDLGGRIWKLNTFDTNSNNWSFNVVYDLNQNSLSQKGQPVTARVAVLRNPVNAAEVFVFLGTGGDTRVVKTGKDRFLLAALKDVSADTENRALTPLRVAGGDFFMPLPDVRDRVTVAALTAPTRTPAGGAVFFAASRPEFNADICGNLYRGTLFGFFIATGQGVFDANAAGDGGQAVVAVAGKITGLYHREEHLYVSQSGGIGLDASTQVLGKDSLPVSLRSSGRIRLEVQDFRVSAF